MKNWSLEDLFSNIEKTGPHPGGGGVTGLAACMGISLHLMAIETTIISIDKKEEKKDLNEAEKRQRSELKEYKEKLKKDREKLFQLSEADGDSFQGVLDALKLDKKDADRDKKLEEGYKEAINLPLRIVDLVGCLYQQSVRLIKICKKSIITDITAGNCLYGACLETSLNNIWINLQGVKEDAFKDRLKECLREHMNEWNETDRAISAYLDDYLPDRVERKGC